MSNALHSSQTAYNFIPVEEVHVEKPPRYISKYRPAVLLEEKSAKEAMRTMGPAQVEMPSPEKYLKKHSKDPKSSEKTQCVKEVHRICTVRKPPVPARTDNPPMGIHTKRDFIKTATVMPMKPQPTFVDTSKGHKQHLEDSGLLPKYIRKKVFFYKTQKKHESTTKVDTALGKVNFGEVPEYLQQRMEEERRAKEEYENLMKEQREQAALKRLSDEERQAILEGLKKNWDKLHQEYQGLSFVIDNISKKHRKERLEADMKQLEKDISYIERFQIIYRPNN